MCKKGTVVILFWADKRIQLMAWVINFYSNFKNLIISIKIQSLAAMDTVQQYIAVIQ